MEKSVYKDFLTIEYEFYNHSVSRVVQKKIEFFTEVGKGKDKSIFYPPTIQDIYYQEFSVPLFKKNFNNGVGNFSIQEPTKEILEKMKDNIARQDKVMDIIKLRNESYNYNCGLIKAGTGVGKSVLAIKICQYYKNHTLILVSNVKLLDELVDRFLEFTGMKVGKYGGGKKEIEGITICTKNSFCRDHDKICSEINFETIIIDECHEGFSDSLRGSLNVSFHNKQISLYGMSATPFTPILETKHLERYFGKIIDVMDKYDYTPDFKIINYTPGKIKVNGEEKDMYTFESYPELRTLMAEDEVRFDYQIKELQKLFLSRKCILVLTDRIIESDNYYNRLSKGDLSKFNLILIAGKTDNEEIKKQLEEAKNNGKKTIIIGQIKKVGTGFDYPPIDTIFLVSAIKWKSTTEQAIGRSLRKYDKLNPLVVIWNDEALKGQRSEKIKTIKRVYGIDKKDILFEDHGDHRSFEEKIKINFSSII